MLAVTDINHGAHFVGYDGNGNVTALVSASDGATSGIYEYSPFGETIRVSGAAAEANPFRFSTKFEDGESGWKYYGYRYLRDGWWVSRDPLDETGWRRSLAQLNSRSEIRKEPNLYAVLINDPVNNVDWLGLKTMQECYDDYSGQKAAGLKLFQKELAGCGMSLGMGTVICIVGCAAANVLPVIGQGVFVACAGAGAVQQMSAYPDSVS